MSCISTVYFIVLINRVASSFLVERGLRKGFPLSPLLFLLMVEGINRAIGEAKSRGEFQVISISTTLRISHLLFVDDVFIFRCVMRGDEEKLSTSLELFGRVIGMHINGKKSTISSHLMDEEEIGNYKELFPYVFIPFDEGLNYLGFHLKPNIYKKED